MKYLIREARRVSELEEKLDDARERIAELEAALAERGKRIAELEAVIQELRCLSVPDCELGRFYVGEERKAWEHGAETMAVEIDNVLKAFDAKETSDDQ